LRGNIPSVPVLPGKGNPDGCVSYKAPARNPRSPLRFFAIFQATDFANAAKTGRVAAFASRDDRQQ